MDNNYDTKRIEVYINKITTEKRCVYCSKLMNESTDFEMGMVSNYYNCDCEGGLLERDIQLGQERLKVLEYKNKKLPTQ